MKKNIESLQKDSKGHRDFSLHLRVRGLRRGGQHRLGAEVASGGEENLQTDAGSALIRVYDDAVDERLGHLARKTAVCLPPLLDGAAQAFHAPNAPASS